MGVAFFQPDHESHISSREYLEGQILKGLGGRAAEEVVYGTGQDHQRGVQRPAAHHPHRQADGLPARAWARRTGLIVFDPDSGPVSSDTHTRMDQDVRAILESSYATVLECMRATVPRSRRWLWR